VAGIAGLVAAAIDLILLGLIPRASSNSRELRTFRRRTLTLTGGSLIGASYGHMGLVVLEAEFIAGGRPYCIEAAGDRCGGTVPQRALAPERFEDVFALGRRRVERVPTRFSRRTHGAD
jgi:hypothetical protein